MSEPSEPSEPSDLVTPFRVTIEPEAVEDLRRRLHATRWPESEPVGDWSQGVPLAYVQDLCRYWADEYDWRAAEDRLNAFPQFRTTIDGVGIHFLHVRSPHPDAVPLILTHGWPGSTVEFAKSIPVLVDPVAFGGDAADAFHVICPSLPGYGFSDKPATTGWGVERIAEAWAVLVERLGFERYGAQGGDWGSSVSTSLAQHVPDRIIGLHLNMPMAIPSRKDGPLSPDDEEVMAALLRFREHEGGYSHEQATRPQTLGYGLVDSPAAQCAWIIEKFRVWMDCDGHPENVLTRDELLDNVSIYWLTASGASSARLYWQSFNRYNRDPVTVPTGCSIFPKEIMPVSRSAVERRFTDLRYWNDLDRGGHFAAFEQPELFVDELRAFFRLVRHP
jgi:pimeloyl-ACP methyl ester carboxylesterase